MYAKKMFTLLVAAFALLVPAGVDAVPDRSTQPGISAPTLTQQSGSRIQLGTFEVGRTNAVNNSGSAAARDFQGSDNRMDGKASQIASYAGNPENRIVIPQAAQQGTIAWAKTFPDGTVLPASLPGKLITCVFPAAGYIFIEEPTVSGKPNKTAGIRVNTTDAFPSGQIVNVSGTVDTQDGERVITPASVQSTQNVDVPVSVGMNNKAVGGSDLNAYTSGVPSGVGLNNIGLLVTVWGTVTYSDSTGCFIDDGSAVTDGNPVGRTGVLISWADASEPPVRVPAVGEYVMATGVVRGASLTAGRKVSVTTDWVKDPPIVLAAAYCVTDSAGNLLTDGWLPVPGGGLDLYVNGQEAQFPDWRLRYYIALVDFYGGQGLDFDTFRYVGGQDVVRDVCLLNDKLQTARGIPPDSDVSEPFCYYPDWWYEGEAGFNTDQIGGYIAFRPEASDIWSTSPESNLRSNASTSYNTEAVFDLYDVAGGNAAAGHSDPCAIVLENVDPARQDVANGYVTRCQLPVRVKNGRGPGTPITFVSGGEPASDHRIWVRNTSTSDWVGPVYQMTVSSSIDHVTLCYGKRISNDYVLPPSFEDWDVRTTILPDATKSTVPVNDTASLFYEWRVFYWHGFVWGGQVYYYTSANSVVVSESDFSFGWPGGTYTSIDSLGVEVKIVNPRDKPYTGTPLHCWFQDSSLSPQHSFSSGIVQLLVPM